METHKQYAKIRIAFAPDIIGPCRANTAEPLPTARRRPGRSIFPSGLTGGIGFKMRVPMISEVELQPELNLAGVAEARRREDLPKIRIVAS
jgi:hypothetical protein